MKYAALIVCGLLTIAQGRTIDTNAAYKPRVVNGEEAKLGERPYQVALLNRGRQFCGGSIINANWVVTAAHCALGESAPNVQVAAGSVSLLEPYRTHQAVQIIVHEDFEQGGSFQNDIALIKVATPFEFSFRIQPAILPQPHAKVQSNSAAVVSGWGYMIDGSEPDKLQKATVYITDPEVCQAAVGGKKIYKTHVCANDPNIRRGECNGDSGGPVTVNGVLTGIVSWSIKSDGGCGSTRFPGVHTRVSEYIDWIQEHIL